METNATAPNECVRLRKEKNREKPRKGGDIKQVLSVSYLSPLQRAIEPIDSYTMGLSLVSLQYPPPCMSLAEGPRETRNFHIGDSVIQMTFRRLILFVYFIIVCIAARVAAGVGARVAARTAARSVDFTVIRTTIRIFVYSYSCFYSCPYNCANSRMINCNAVGATVLLYGQEYGQLIVRTAALLAVRAAVKGAVRADS